LRPVGELRQPAELLRKANRLLERAFETLLPHRHVEAGLAERIRERAEGVPVERLGRQLAAVLVDVTGRGHTTELLPELLEQRQQLLAGRKAPRYEPGLALRAIPAAEVLDHGLWVDGGLRIGGELPHRRRAPQPFSGLLQLCEDLLVRVALANPGLEL